MSEPDDDDSARMDDWFERKTDLMVDILGPEHDMVMHAMIPYSIGGSLDLYYFPNGIEGCAIATKELSELPGEGSSNDLFDCYELVMFTRHRLSLEDAKNASTPFGKSHRTINGVLNCIARYSAQAKLNPCDTSEFPPDFGDGLGGKCLLFDAYGCDGAAREFGLVVVMEIHRSELEFARQQRGRELIERLKAAGYYPYSDIDRPAVAWPTNSFCLRSLQSATAHQSTRQP